MSLQRPLDLPPVADVLWETLIPAGTHWSGMLRRGLALRIAHGLAHGGDPFLRRKRRGVRNSRRPAAQRGVTRLA